MSKPDQEMLDFINELNQILEDDDFGYLDNIIPDLDTEFCSTGPKSKKKSSDGETCKKCKNHYEFAEPNQPDGTLICYSCRNY